MSDHDEDASPWWVPLLILAGFAAVYVIGSLLESLL